MDDYRRDIHRFYFTETQQPIFNGFFNFPAWSPAAYKLLIPGEYTKGVLGDYPEEMPGDTLINRQNWKSFAKDMLYFAEKPLAEFLPAGWVEADLKYKFSICPNYFTFWVRQDIAEPNRHKRNAYEVILGSHPQKPHFELDIEEIDQPREFGDRLRSALIMCIMQVFSEVGIILDLSHHFLIYTSHSWEKCNPNGSRQERNLNIEPPGPGDKYSCHIIIDGFYHQNNEEAKALYFMVKRLIPDRCRILGLSITDAQLTKMMDPAFYNPKQQVRMLGQQKSDPDEKKRGRIKVFNPRFEYNSSLIVYAWEGTPADFDRTLHSNVQLPERGTGKIFNHSLNLPTPAELMQFRRSLITNVMDCQPLPPFVNPMTKLDTFNGSALMDTTVVNINEEDRREIEMILRQALPDHYFKLSKKKGNTILLRREDAGWCPLCLRVHEAIDAYLRLKWDGTITFRCFRDITKKLILGKLSHEIGEKPLGLNSCILPDNQSFLDDSDIAFEGNMDEMMLWAQPTGVARSLGTKQNSKITNVDDEDELDMASFEEEARQMGLNIRPKALGSNNNQSSRLVGEAPVYLPPVIENNVILNTESRLVLPISTPVMVEPSVPSIPVMTESSIPALTPAQELALKMNAQENMLPNRMLELIPSVIKPDLSPVKVIPAPGWTIKPTHVAPAANLAPSPLFNNHNHTSAISPRMSPALPINYTQSTINYVPSQPLSSVSYAQSLSPMNCAPPAAQLIPSVSYPQPQVYPPIINYTHSASVSYVPPSSPLPAAASSSITQRPASINGYDKVDIFLKTLKVNQEDRQKVLNKIAQSNDNQEIDFIKEIINIKHFLEIPLTQAELDHNARYVCAFLNGSRLKNPKRIEKYKKVLNDVYGNPITGNINNPWSEEVDFSGGGVEGISYEENIRRKQELENQASIQSAGKKGRPKKKARTTMESASKAFFDNLPSDSPATAAYAQ